MTRDCIVLGCEHETHAECYACAGRDNRFDQMYIGRNDFSLNVEERFDAFFPEESEICFYVKMSVFCCRICVIWHLSRMWHGWNVCAYLTRRGFAPLVFDRSKFVCSL